MTIFNTPANRQLEEHLVEKATAGVMTLIDTNSSNTNELIMYTLQTLEYLKIAYQNEEEHIYGEYIENGKFNDKVQYLIDNSPVAINPNFIDVPIEELPDTIVNHYKELMNIKDENGYLYIDPRSIIKEHYENSERFGFYNNNNNFKYLISDEYLIGRGNLPMDPIYSMHSNIYELYNATEYVSTDYMTENIIKIDKEKIDYRAFIHLHSIYYFDLYMRTFYAKEMNTYKKFKTINFVDADTEGALTFDELIQYKTDIGTLKEYVGLTYHQYRLQKENSRARRSINCNLNNRNLNEIGFVFGETEDKIIDIEYMRTNVINTMYGRNIQGDYIEYSSNIREILNNLPRESFEIISENVYEVLGITNLYEHSYLTDAVMLKLNQVLHGYRERLQPKDDEEEFQETFGYLAYADELETAISRTVEKLENEVANITVESE